MQTNDLPIIDAFFNIEKALKEYGFSIDDKDSGWCVGYGISHHYYGAIQIEFRQAFINNIPVDMCLFYYDDQHQIHILYKGVTPTNQRDFNTLMELLLPSKEFISKLESNFFE